MDRDQINSQLKEFDTATIERITETLVKKAHQEEEDNRTMLPIKGTSSSSYQRPVKKVKVRIKPTDDLGAAPMPEGQRFLPSALGRLRTRWPRLR